MYSLTDSYKLSNGVQIPCIGFGTWQTVPNNIIKHSHMYYISYILLQVALYDHKRREARPQVKAALFCPVAKPNETGGGHKD